MRQIGDRRVESCQRACGLEVAPSIAERALAAPRRGSPAACALEMAACVLEGLVNANYSLGLRGVLYQ